MKRFKQIISIFLFFSLAACLDVNEEIVIDANGRGRVNTQVDMGELMGMMQSMAAEEDIASSGLDRVIDTTIRMRDVLDSSKDATVDQKRIFSDATLLLKINMKESLMKTDVLVPFSNYNDLQTIMSGAATQGLAEAFKRVLPGADSGRAAPPRDQAIDRVNTIFDVTATKNLLSRKLNRQRYDELMEKPEMAQAKEMSGNGMDVSYTTTIRLPRPVKRSDNPLLTFSTDKKTVTMKYDLTDLLNEPDKFSYSIAY